ncbi:MAG: adenosylcobinamide-phosphate synthase CbiB [Bacillota bacterium]
MISFAAVIAGFLIDLAFGDPMRCPHIVVGMGKMIQLLEPRLRNIAKKTPKGESRAGLVLAILLPLSVLCASWGALYLCSLIHPLLRFVVESLLCWQCLALRSLKSASSKVHHALAEADLERARTLVGQIVGRDTAALDTAGVTRAAVETVAENTSDGVIAPLIYLFIGGAPLGILYKCINTLDSMVGYKNDRYLYFGRASARLDDAANFLPARFAGVMMVLCAFAVGLDGKNAWRIFRRDRLRHSSPNSAHTEAACAGALNIRLGGDSYYFGKLVHKPTIGDDGRPIQTEDILLANRLLFWTAAFSLILFALLKGALLWL